MRSPQFGTLGTSLAYASLELLGTCPSLEIRLPLQKLLVACSSFTVGRKRVPKQSVQEFLPRKLQLKWCKFKASSPYPWVEALAQDREGWNLQLKPWLRQWGYGAGPKPRSPNFLLDRQLLMVGKQLAVLRPARVFPDEPYHQEVQHVCSNP